ncbi:hypothetical protein [Tranquillimonas alkanivorans]|uniref:Uncharacterized protein n=1 Tax=Tranquillimonas alkanivorans TaxID=441119 RepID=A0A1I5SZH3_9RHOB|nr:hypothetical protein [Tranquillimonas alkanivorans]SFP75837.1 hypothetical protein SAMN04488047_11258 [Tranquillimonas alkanivorans]
MDRLSILLTLMTGAVLTGGLAILFFTFNWYSWWSVGVAAVIGFALAWPLAYVISRKVKRDDPNWREDRVKDAKKPVPPPDAPEV